MGGVRIGEGALTGDEVLMVSDGWGDEERRGDAGRVMAVVRGDERIGEAELANEVVRGDEERIGEGGRAGELICGEEGRAVLPIEVVRGDEERIGEGGRMAGGELISGEEGRGWVGVDGRVERVGEVGEAEVGREEVEEVAQGKAGVRVGEGERVGDGRE